MKYSPNKLKKALKNIDIKDDVEITGYWVADHDDPFPIDSYRTGYLAGDVIVELSPKDPQPGSMSWTINAGNVK